MAKVIKYKFLPEEIINGTGENPDMEQLLRQVTMSWNESNEEIAKREAYNGEYTVEDDGQEEGSIPTESERLDALEAAMLELMGVTADG